MSQKSFAAIKADIADKFRQSGTKNAEGPEVRAVLEDVLDSINPTLDGVLKDDDNAATAGTAINVVQEAAGVAPYLVSTAAGDASYLAEIADGVGAITINDSDSPGGVQLYFDEDATDTDKRFMCVSPDAKDILVPIKGGGHLRVVHNADAATDGVEVYGDDDAANLYERLLFVSPNDTDGTFTTDDEL